MQSRITLVNTNTQNTHTHGALDTPRQYYNAQTSTFEVFFQSLDFLKKSVNPMASMRFCELLCVCESKSACVCSCVYNSVSSYKPLSARHARQKPCNSNESPSGVEALCIDKLQMEVKTKDSN